MPKQHGPMNLGSHDYQETLLDSILILFVADAIAAIDITLR
jgi:hypothetical protein